MTKNIVEYSYYIDLPINEALMIKEDLEDQIWKIARENKVEEELHNVNFKTRSSEPALDVDFLIEFVVFWNNKTHLLNSPLRITDPIIGEVVCTTFKQLWDHIFLLKLKYTFGDDALKEEDNDGSSNY